LKDQPSEKDANSASTKVGLYKVPA